VRVIATDAKRLDGLAGGSQHQGVVAKVAAQAKHLTLDDVLDGLAEPALLLVLDGVTDPHNLGACLRVADAAGAHAVVAPKDRACGLNATAIKVASGAADSVPYIVVTNLARSLREMQERDIWVIGAAGEAEKSLYAIDQKRSCAWVLGAEGDGMRRLTRETCDELARIPMLGSVESLNVSVSAGICLFERQASAQRISHNPCPAGIECLAFAARGRHRKLILERRGMPRHPATEFSLRVGVPSIDREHLDLVAHLDRLQCQSRCEPGNGCVFGGSQSPGPADQCAFRQRGSDPPRLRHARADRARDHIRAHTEILDQYARLNLELMHGKAVSREEALVMIREWIVEHVLNHDMKIAEYASAGEHPDPA
jgi:23S rRNA (guanosine2251-2'-O)-methyltransferase